MKVMTAFTERLGLEYPIIQAPMAGFSTPEMCIAVSGAGGLGCIAAAVSTPDQITQMSAAVRAGTSKPFGINLFAPVPHARAANSEAALNRVAGYFAELGLPRPEMPGAAGEDFDRQFDAVLESGAAVFSFTFGLLPERCVAAAKARGMLVAGTATTVNEARLLKAAGVDAIVAQGSEAGAHRGTFDVPFDRAMVGTMALVPQVADATGLPVIAAGGIGDGRGIAAALMLGADAAQPGTAFLLCDESGAPEAHKLAIEAAQEDETRVTRAYSGRPARGIVNRFMNEVEAGGADAVLPYPQQNVLTRALRAEAARQGRPEFLSLWAGQAMGLARREPAAATVRRLASEMEAALGRYGAG